MSLMRSLCDGRIAMGYLTQMNYVWDGMQEKS